ncbi:MAG: serine/threonine-protein kinase [Chloroflexota bacterium]
MVDSSKKQPASPGQIKTGDFDSVNEVLETDLTNKQVGRYLVQRKLGSGGSAVVYQAFDQVRGRSVALKVLASTADEKTLSRFRREAMTSGALHHDHIVRTLQVGVAAHGDVAYIAMELVEGEGLNALLDRSRYLDPDEACALLAPIASALAHAHENGIIHRDVKPSNILLQPTRSGNRHSIHIDVLDYPVVPMLSDFGIARSLDSPELTNQGRTVGTPAYMAPEQCSGQRNIDGRADVYSLGAVLYRMIVGHQPFTGSTPQILHAHVYEQLTIENELLRKLPPLVVEILAISLAKSPEERYTNARQMATALAEAGGISLDGDAVAEDEQAAELMPTATITLDNLQPSNNDPSSSASILVPGLPTQSGNPEGEVVTESRHNLGRQADTMTPTPLEVATRFDEEERPPSRRLEEPVSWRGGMLLAIGILVGALTALIMSGQLNRLLGVTGDVGATEQLPNQATLAPFFPTMTSTPNSVANPPTFTSIPPSETPTDVPLIVTLAPTNTPTPVPTATQTVTPLPTPTSTVTPISTSTHTPTITPTETPIPATATEPPTPTWTPVGGIVTPTVELSPTTSPTPGPAFTTPKPTEIPPTPTWTPLPNG